MLSVIVPAYNNPDEVRMLLDSVAKSEKTDFPFEVLIIDDGSRDSEIGGVAALCPFARYIKLDKNSGAAAARNEGARSAKYGSLFFVDSDVTVFSDTLANVKRHFENPDVRAFIGRLNTVPLNSGFFPEYKALMFNSWLPKDGYSTVLSPAVGGVRKDIFFESGGFDETIKGATVEYVKFSYELRKRCKIWFFPDVVVRVKINTFRKAIFTDFYSTMKWVTIFSRYKKLDNHCTTPAEAVGRLAGFLLAVLFVPLFIFKFYALLILLFLVYLFLNRAFFIMVYKAKPLPFFLASIVTHVALSVMVVLGGLAGAVLVIIRSILKRDR